MKIISGALALSMVTAMPLNASAESKEEVIYVMAGADGTVNSVYAVNSFDGGDISDYGDYSSVKLLNVDGNITKNGDEISFSSPENGKVYYQGTLADTEIPWNISIRYFLDGKELSANDIAGKSGALEIRISITENGKCKSDFYKDFALQCSFTLNTENCRNITAEGATIANVGKKKQITYTVLPDRGLEKSIFADVTDFEMDAGSINGIKMNLGIDIGDDDIKDKVNKLTDGAVELDDGAKELHDGTVELKNGVSELNDGIEKLGSGISELKIAASCDSYQAVMGANGLDVDALKAGNEQAIAQLTAQITELKTTLAQIKNIPQYAEQTAQLTAQVTQLETIVQLLMGNSALIGGTEAYFGELQQGASQLENGAKELAKGGSNLADGAKKLMDGAAELSDGTAELRNETDKIDSTFSDDLDDLSGMLESLSGGTTTVRSFVSNKNTDVSSVQFVIKTDAIEIPEPEEAAPESPEKLNFWQKLLRLFGLY